MRRSRIKADGGGYYHCMSRIIERRHIFGDAEKQRFLTLMRDLAAFGGLEIFTFSLMSNHFHILLHVPERRELSDDELLERLRYILNPRQVELIGMELEDYRRQGLHQAAEALKQRFSQFYNVRSQRRGPLWEQRFKSLLVEGSQDALLTIAAYIDLNPVRAGLVMDPKDYRYGGYGQALGGDRAARQGLRRLMQAAQGGRLSWGKAQAAYRQRLYVQGQSKGLAPQGGPTRQGFTAEQVRAVLAMGGRLPMPELLRCRVRYFSDGLAMGSAAFVDTVFQRYRDQFGPRRQEGARPMRYGHWDGLCTLRDLRLAPVVRD